MVGRVYPDYRVADAVQENNLHLHNVPMQIAAERGLPALAMWLWFVGAAVAGLRPLLERRNRVLAATALGAIAAMLTTAVALADADARALHGAPVLIPAPASIALREGSFTLRDGTLVSVEGGDQALLVAQQFAARVLAEPDHSFEELASVENADAVEEHDQAGEADWPDDVCLRCKCADREADEQHRADAQREAEDINLADQVADADGEKDRKDRLGADDVLGEFNHGRIPPSTMP